ncbi:transposable element Tcb1 transposase [Trichonephila clavipes]|nr:transposable element Tcb1 transposase [Trichonephila clavipes]
MVWAGIVINGCTRLHVVANGTMTGQQYIDEVLLLYVRLFRGAVGDKFVFMDDNATCHRTHALQDCLDSEGFWRQVAGRNYPPTNKNTLIRALTEEWNKLPQQLLDNVVQRSPLGQIIGRLSLQWAHDHRAWQADWPQVVFSDESRFCFWYHDGCIRVRRYAGERCLPECVFERHSGLTLGVTGWGAEIEWTFHPPSESAMSFTPTVEEGMGAVWNGGDLTQF